MLRDIFQTVAKFFMSRKALYPLLYLLLTVFNQALGSPLSEKDLETFANLALGFILGESGIDALRAWANAKAAADAARSQFPK